MAIAGHVSPKMLAHYSHVRMDAKRKALDALFTVFERLFKERGLPVNIRSDNGVPFASAHALFNLSKRIGIERIKPGHPLQNGRHERMHLTRTR